MLLDQKSDTTSDAVHVSPRPSRLSAGSNSQSSEVLFSTSVSRHGRQAKGDTVQLTPRRRMQKVVLQYGNKEIKGYIISRHCKMSCYDLRIPKPHTCVKCDNSERRYHQRRRIVRVRAGGGVSPIVTLSWTFLHSPPVNVEVAVSD